MITQMSNSCCYGLQPHPTNKQLCYGKLSLATERGNTLPEKVKLLAANTTSSHWYKTTTLRVDIATVLYLRMVKRDGKGRRDGRGRRGGMGGGGRRDGRGKGDIFYCTVHLMCVCKCAVCMCCVYVCTYACVCVCGVWFLSSKVCKHM